MRTYLFAAAAGLFLGTPVVTQAQQINPDSFIGKMCYADTGTKNGTEPAKGRVFIQVVKSGKEYEVLYWSSATQFLSDAQRVSKSPDGFGSAQKNTIKNGDFTFTTVKGTTYNIRGSAENPQIKYTSYEKEENLTFKCGPAGETYKVAGG